MELGLAVKFGLDTAVVIEDTIANPGAPFTVDVTAHLAEPLHSFTFDLKFDPDILQAIGVKDGVLLNRNGVDSTSWNTPDVDNEEGIIFNIAWHRGEDGSTVENKGVLATVVFTAVKAGKSTLTLQNVHFVGLNGEKMAVREQAGGVEVYSHGRISGVVRDASDQTPIANAKISVSNRWFSLPEVYADIKGKYTVDGVPAGSVKVMVSKQGKYAETTKKNIRTQFDVETTAVNFDLERIPIRELAYPSVPTSEPPADSFFPAWSPDGHKIAFTSNRDGNYEIYVMDVDGSSQTRITDNPVTDVRPTWSPDGRHIAFMSDHDGDGGIYVMKTDGAEQLALTSNIVSLTLDRLPPHSEVNLRFDLYLLDSWDGAHPSMGPDYFRVGFGESLVNLLDATFDGGSQRAPSYRATKPEKSGEKLGFSWWTDTIYRNLNNGFSFPHTGNSLTLNFSASTTSQLDDESWGIDNVKVTVDGVEVLNDDFEEGAAEVWSHQIINTDHTDAFTKFLGRFGAVGGGLPAWSPDGNRIAINVTTMRGNEEIFVTNTDGSTRISLTRNPTSDTWPAWSPDGRYIAFQSEQSGNDEIWIMHPDGTGQRNLTNHPAGDGGSPAWSPDARKIAFTSIRDFNLEVYVIDVDGANPTRLTEDDATDGWPAWSPDGNKIAFTSNRDGNFEIYVMDVDGSNPVRLTHTQHEGIAEDGKASK